ncbi:hypothetical protein PILCRDRAFT_810120 [Piloderma croceum F 1598]|uniref:Calcineurin-like phosphoesterase domain-containing protein n=1 Tax=Piloderma croceum (strain F 1598) TaxID=765440 RepID=A0A0C3GNP0_PILCF|nr:hypothetical protein PILCRDRAFT_810120 [Piloderma croceum F 1598]
MDHQLGEIESRARFHWFWRCLPPRHRLFIRALRLCWIAGVVWLELGTFDRALSSCHWPVPKTEDESDPPRISNILIIADPQILSSRSYPNRNFLLSRLTQLVVDLNLRKSWRLAMKMRPHVVVFLGDMMDNGRDEMGDHEYKTYHKRFRNMFKIPYYPMAAYYLPGNHDTGLGASPSFSPNATARYKSHFGPLNHRITISNHSVLFIDAPGLVEEDRERMRHGYPYGGIGEGGKGGWSAMPGGTVDFVRQFAAKKIDKPTVLFTHIPLSRPDGTDCGPLREKGTITRGAGHGYQNTLNEEASNFLLQNLRPSIIFSGDDHDYCDISHPMPLRASSPKTRLFSPEITVKSLSIVMNVRHPGFQLLSLVSQPSYQEQLHTPCALPDQLGIYLWGYAVMGVVSVVLILVANFYRETERGRGWGKGREWGSVSSGTLSTTGDSEQGVGLVERPRGGASARRATLDAEDGKRGGKLSASFDEAANLDEREGEGFMNGIVHGLGNGNEVGNGHADVDAPALLPQTRFVPAPSHHHHHYRDRAFSWTFVLGSRRRRISIPSIFDIGRSLLGVCGCGRAWTGRRRGGMKVRDNRVDGERLREGLITRSIHDVQSVAWLPVVVYMLIALWMFVDHDFSRKYSEPGYPN